MAKKRQHKRIYATTDKARGALKHLADEEGYETFVVPDDVGGRFSVLTAVGLLPIAVSGADITKLDGGRSFRQESMHLEAPFEKNDALKYAAVRNILLRKGKAVSRFWQTMSRACTMYPSGGNSSTARARARIRRVFSRHRLI